MLHVVLKLAAGILLVSPSTPMVIGRRSCWSFGVAGGSRQDSLAGRSERESDTPGATIDAARAEFEEETHAGLALPVELGEVVEPSGRRVAVWAANAAWSAERDEEQNGHWLAGRSLRLRGSMLAEQRAASTHQGARNTPS